MLLDYISRETGISPTAIESIARRAMHMYKVYEIPKRVGGGSRVIEHPAKELKVLQRWIAVRLLSQLPVHPAVYSYRRGIGIAAHAAQHHSHRFLVRLDLRDFFPSISANAVRHLLGRAALTPGIDREDLSLIIRIVCRGDRLTIGAPSSPAISNAVLYTFDEYVFEYAAERGVTYTRYADDLYFSTNAPNVLEEMLPLVRERLQLVPGLGLRVNESKSTYTSPKRKRLVTGVVITPQGQLSIGRQRKRQIRTLMYQFSQGALSPEEVSRLKGLVAFAVSVEPEVRERLARKFGHAVLESLGMAQSVSTKRASKVIGFRQH